MKKIGLFGGCFNPPTDVHINLAKKALKENKLDKVIFVPVGDCYPKENLEKAIHRYNMLKIATKDCDNIEVDDIELRISTNICAVDIFKLLSEKYKEDDIYFIMGSDNYEKMPNWKEYNYIKEKYKYIILERDCNIINSTEIRKKMLKNEDVSEYLSQDLIRYIKNNNLYK